MRQFALVPKILFCCKYWQGCVMMTPQFKHELLIEFKHSNKVNNLMHGSLVSSVMFYIIFSLLIWQSTQPLRIFMTVKSEILWNVQLITGRCTHDVYWEQGKPGLEAGRIKGWRISKPNFHILCCVVSKPIRRCKTRFKGETASVALREINCSNW